MSTYPNAPTLNQIITVNGARKQWDGTKWVSIQTGDHEQRIDTLEEGSELHLTIAQAQAETSLILGQFIRLRDRGLSLWQVKSGLTANGIDVIDHTPTQNQLELVIENGLLDSSFLGVTANTASTPHGDNFRRLFEMSGNVNVTEVLLPNSNVYFNNTTAASFQNNCTYTGGKNTCIIPTVFNQRVFLTQNKTNFEINKIKSEISEAAGGQDNWIGGGYWRFENCTLFSWDTVEVSKSFGTGIKLTLCSDFKLNNTRGYWNGFVALELAGCKNYEIDGVKGYYNGKFSSDNSYKPLPTGFTGAGPGGRALVIAAEGNEVDQEYSSIRNVRAVSNSEYGVRCFAANTLGVKNVHFDTIVAINNGHPAGTYGDTVVTDDFGVDFLVNSDASGESENITWENLEIVRALGYGTPLSVDGLNHEQKDVKISLIGLAEHELTACQLFGAKSFKSTNLVSHGAKQHYAFGTASRDVELVGDRAFGCKKFMLSYPAGTTNIIRQGRAYHDSTTAVSDENAVVVGAAGGVLQDMFFDGFHRAVINDSASVTFDNVKTVNSVILGLVDNQSGVDGTIFKNCDFDSANVFPRIGAVGEGAGPRNLGFSFNADMPTSGYFKAGYIVFDMTPTVGTLGWRRLTTGTNHVLGTDWELISTT